MRRLAILAALLPLTGCGLHMTGFTLGRPASAPDYSNTFAQPAQTYLTSNGHMCVSMNGMLTCN